jgi:hypothetical protein
VDQIWHTKMLQSQTRQTHLSGTEFLYSCPTAYAEPSRVKSGSIRLHWTRLDSVSGPEAVPGCAKLEVEVFMVVVSVKIVVLWDMTPCTLVDEYQHLGGTTLFWRWRKQFLPKRWYLSNNQHSVAFQKTSPSLDLPNFNKRYSGDRDMTLQTFGLL